MYCDVNDLLSKIDVEHLMNISRVSFPAYLNSAVYETLFSSLTNEERAFVDTLYSVEDNHYVLKEMSLEDKEKFLLIYLKVMDNNNIEKAIKSASSLIDGYLVGRYTVPLKNVPDNIKIFCANIAIAELLIDKGVTESEADKAIIRRKEDAIRFLENVAKGNFNLPIKENDIAYPKTDFIKVDTKAKLSLEGYF